MAIVLTKQASGYFYLDLLKAFFAVCVVAIHAKLGQVISNEYGLAIFNFFVSCAVPFFFVSSGYLLAEKTTGLTSEDEQMYLHRNILKYIKMYVRWNIYYLPVTIWGFCRDWKSGAGIVKIGLTWIRGFFFIGEQFCSWPLWYLLSMILGVYIVKLILRQVDKKSHWIAVIGVGFFALAWMLNIVREYPEPSKLLGIIQKLIIYTIGNGRIFTGVAFVLLGIWTYYHMCAMSWSLYTSLLLIPICVALSITCKVEYSTTYPLVLFVVPPIVKVSCSVKKVSFENGSILRKFSQDAYFMHMYFVFLLTYNVLSFEKISLSPVWVFSLTLLGIVLIDLCRKYASGLVHIRS